MTPMAANLLFFPLRKSSVRVATRKLTQLDAAVTNDDMGSPPGNDLKFYDGFWHIRINDQWRLAWQWIGDGPESVKIYDPH
ncbi:proteic killer suppression protein [Variovorax sp. CF079]|nr:proteic killer suppression protein [Variovorax sp. CF079]